MNEPCDALEYQAYRKLCAAVLLEAVRDWNRMQKRHADKITLYGGNIQVRRRSVREFFNSRWFLILCDSVDLDSEQVLSEIAFGERCEQTRRTKNPAD